MPHSFHLQPTLPQTHSSFMTDSNVQALASLDNLVMSSASQKQYSGGGGGMGERKKRKHQNTTQITQPILLCLEARIVSYVTAHTQE